MDPQDPTTRRSLDSNNPPNPCPIVGRNTATHPITYPPFPKRRAMLRYALLYFASQTAPIIISYAFASFENGVARHCALLDSQQQSAQPRSRDGCPGRCRRARSRAPIHPLDTSGGFRPVGLGLVVWCVVDSGLYPSTKDGLSLQSCVVEVIAARTVLAKSGEAGDRESATLTLEKGAWCPSSHLLSASPPIQHPIPSISAVVGNRVSTMSNNNPRPFLPQHPALPDLARLGTPIPPLLPAQKPQHTRGLTIATSPSPTNPTPPRVLSPGRHEPLASVSHLAPAPLLPENDLHAAAHGGTARAAARTVVCGARGRGSGGVGGCGRDRDRRGVGGDVFVADCAGFGEAGVVLLLVV